MTTLQFVVAFVIGAGACVVLWQNRYVATLPHGIRTEGLLTVDVPDGFSGKSDAVNAAFRTTMRTFAYGGKQRIANDSAVQVPAALGGIVNAVLGLQNLNVPHTIHHIVGPVHAYSNNIGIQAAAAQTSHSPKDFPAIYDAGSTPTASTGCPPG